MQALILAAGRGSRMGSLTSNIPKPLIQISRKTIISRCIDSLPQGINECVIVVGYRGNQIIDHLGLEYRDIKISYVWQGEQSGTGGGLLQARDALNGGKFLIIHGDNIYSKQELSEIVSNNVLTYGITSEISSEQSRTVIFDSTNRLMGWGSVSKGSLRWFGIGAYLLDENIWDVKLHELNSGEFSIPHSLHNLKQPVKVYESKKWLSINTPQELKIAVSRLWSDQNSF
jgi:NDP-sugar pyrophosphorylase family protein